LHEPPRPIESRSAEQPRSCHDLRLLAPDRRSRASKPPMTSPAASPAFTFEAGQQGEGGVIAGQRLEAEGVPAEVPCTYWTRLVVTARVHTIFFNISESRGAIRHNVAIPTDWAALSLYLFRGAPGCAEWVLK